MSRIFREKFLFYGLEELDLSRAFFARYAAGEFICQEGHPFTRLLFVLSGKAKVCITTAEGKTMLFSFYEGGGLLGDVELMSEEYTASTTVQAITDFEGIALPFSAYAGELKCNVTFMNRIGALLAGKLARCTRNSAFTILNTLDARLCAYMLMMGDGEYFCEKMTELAELMGTSYRHLLRTLERLSRRGLVEKVTPGTYRLKNPELLRRRAGDFYRI